MASALQIEDYTLILEHLKGENKLEDLLENSEELEKHRLALSIIEIGYMYTDHLFMYHY